MKYNGVHRQQLFHWIGRHIEYPDKDNPKHRIKELGDNHREQYVCCLRSALKNGLWVKVPDDPDVIGDGALISVRRPILCFTEWSLGESLGHTSQYGRLGIGVSKSFVLGKGGQPVVYVRSGSSRGSPYVKAFVSLAKFMATLPESSRNDHIKENFEFAAHFLKRIKRTGEPKVKKKAITAMSKGERSYVKPDPFRRQFGKTLHFLEEREWRIVMSESLQKKLQPKEDSDFWNLRVEPGRELFTVVLPDSRTIRMALDDGVIRRKLYPKDAPHVTVLSLEDIGTF